jgi:hypothetical protein
MNGASREAPSFPFSVPPCLRASVPLCLCGGFCFLADDPQPQTLGVVNAVL